MKNLKDRIAVVTGAASGIGVTSVHPAGVRTNIAKSARTDKLEMRSQAIDIIERLSVTPERCAELIVKAIKKNKMRQLVTRESVLIDTVKRMAPGLPQVLMERGDTRGMVDGIDAATK